MRCRITQFARESVGLCPFRGSYVREFELSHSNPVNRIIKITHAHNLHVKIAQKFNLSGALLFGLINDAKDLQLHHLLLIARHYRYAPKCPNVNTNSSTHCGNRMANWKRP